MVVLRRHDDRARRTDPCRSVLGTCRRTKLAPYEELALESDSSIEPGGSGLTIFGSPARSSTNG